MKRVTPLLSAATALTAMVGLTHTASAQVVGTDVISALNSQLEFQGASIVGGNISTSGDTVTVTGATMSFSGEDDAEFLISQLTLEGVEANGDGGYTVARASVPPFAIDEDGTSASFGEISVTNYVIASPDETDVILRAGLFDTLTMGPINVAQDGKQAFSLAGVVAEVGEYRPGETWASSMTAQDFVINSDAFNDRNAQQTLAALGYDTLTGDLTARGVWEPTDGTMVIEDFTIAVDDAASIGFDLGIGGYTIELVEAMQQINATAQNEQAAGMAILGLMQQLEIGGAAITVTDASLTEKLLEFFGTQQGTNADGMRAFAKGMLPLGLAQLQSPEFAAQATAAIGQFLDNPGTLVLEAQPASPIPVLALAGPVMSGNPAQLIEALSLNIRTE